MSSHRSEPNAKARRTITQINDLFDSIAESLTTFSSMSSVGTMDLSSHRGSFHDTPPLENMPKAAPCTVTTEAPLVKNRHRTTHTGGHKRVDSSPPSVSLFMPAFFWACVRAPPDCEKCSQIQVACAMRFFPYLLISFFSSFFIYDQPSIF